MPLSWNEIRNHAHEFSKRWEPDQGASMVETSQRLEAYLLEGGM